jgi:sensor histidine kinase regulating citrate/malate metabolism
MEMLVQFSKQKTVLTITDPFSEMPEKFRSSIPDILKSNAVEKLNERDEWGIWAVKKIIAAHNGTIDFLSKPKGEIEFKISL